MCPFCYIGKRKFEAGLARFAHKDEVNIIWKSFQLQPDAQSEPGKSTVQHLAEAKGISVDEARRMTDHVTSLAREVGLEYHMDNAVIANSFDAHRLIHLAHQHGLGNAAKESLLRAYFTEGRDTADHATLQELGRSIGLDAAETAQMLASDQFAEAVDRDVYEARQVGVRGVPFFVINRKYAISGAQQPDTFLGALETARPEWSLANPVFTDLSTDGPVCAPGEVC